MPFVSNFAYKTHWDEVAFNQHIFPVYQLAQRVPQYCASGTVCHVSLGLCQLNVGSDRIFRTLKCSRVMHTQLFTQID